MDEPGKNNSSKVVSTQACPEWDPLYDAGSAWSITVFDESRISTIVSGRYVCEGARTDPDIPPLTRASG